MNLSQVCSEHRKEGRAAQAAGATTGQKGEKDQDS